MSDNAQSSHNAPPLPQPPPAKRAKKSHPQPDPLDTAVHIAKQPTCQAPHAPTTPTNKGASNTSTEHAPQVLPGRRGDDVSIRQYRRGDMQLALAIASDPSHAAKALQLIEVRSYATSGKLARESKFRTWEQVASTMGPPRPIRVVASQHQNNGRDAGHGGLSFCRPARRAGQAPLRRARTQLDGQHAASL
jgi:hypothetical protein